MCVSNPLAKFHGLQIQWLSSPLERNGTRNLKNQVIYERQQSKCKLTKRQTEVKLQEEIHARTLNYSHWAEITPAIICLARLRPPLLPLLVVPDELRQLCLQIVGLREPIRRRSAFDPAGHCGQAVLDRDQALAGELVEHHMRSFFTQFPVRKHRFTISSRI